MTTFRHLYRKWHVEMSVCATPYRHRNVRSRFNWKLCILFCLVLNHPVRLQIQGDQHGLDGNRFCSSFTKSMECSNFPNVRSTANCSWFHLQCKNSIKISKCCKVTSKTNYIWSVNCDNSFIQIWISWKSRINLFVDMQNLMEKKQVGIHDTRQLGSSNSWSLLPFRSCRLCKLIRLCGSKLCAKCELISAVSISCLWNMFPVNITFLFRPNVISLKVLKVWRSKLFYLLFFNPSCLQRPRRNQQNHSHLSEINL